MFQLPMQSPKMHWISDLHENKNKFIYLESSHDQWNDHISLFLCHFCTDCKKHEHVIALDNAHGIEIAQNVCASNFSHHVGVVHDGIEEISSLHQAQAPMSEWSDGTVKSNPDARNGHMHELIIVRRVVLLKRSHQLVEHLWREMYFYELRANHLDSASMHSPCGTLQPLPFKSANRVRRKLASRSCAVGSNCRLKSSLPISSFIP